MDNTNPLVSVIIPVYNNERHIGACIGSVVCQSYKNLEIIVVNDGSIDNSPAIIKKMACADTRLTCIDQPNAGTNLARKAGLDAAKGKYIQYLDGDDTLLPDAIERLVERAETTSADIVSAPFVFCEEDGTRTGSPVLPVDELSGIEYFRKIFEWEGATWNMWGNFQKRSLVYDYNIEILPNVPYGQDATWMIQIFFHNPKIVTLKTPILNYNRNPQSVSFSKDAAAKRYKGARTLYHWFEQFLKNSGREQEFKKESAVMHLNMTFICIQALRFDNVREDMKKAVENINRYPELAGRLSVTEQRMIRIFRRSPVTGNLYILYYRMKRAVRERIRPMVRH